MPLASHAELPAEQATATLDANSNQLRLLRVDEDLTERYVGSSYEVKGKIVVHVAALYAAPRRVIDVDNVTMAWDSVLIDCNRRIWTIFQHDYYRTGGAQPVRVKSITIPPERLEMSTLAPNEGSLIGELYRRVCPAHTNSPSRTVLAANTPAEASAEAPPDATTLAPPTLPGINNGHLHVELPRTSDKIPNSQDTVALAEDQPHLDPDAQERTTNHNAAAGHVRQEQLFSAPANKINYGTKKPFSDSALSLRTLALLAQYVYFDSSKADVERGVYTKLKQADARHPSSGIINDALVASDKRLRQLAAKEEAKRSAIEEAQLVQVPLPMTGAKSFPGFYAELYQHKVSGEQVLVFRGSQNSYDWVSNVWVGLDLHGIEAPHYAAARALVDEVHKKSKPVVVGHSLGGGMAQYVGLLYNLKTVAFNSSPLPKRYFDLAAKQKRPDLSRFRLYSAVERVPLGSMGDYKYHPDPLSIGLPNFPEYLKESGLPGSFLPQSLVKADHHIVKPLCVLSEPDYHADEEHDAEEKDIAAFFSYKEEGLMMEIMEEMEKGLTGRKGKDLVRVLGPQNVAALLDPVWKSLGTSAYDREVNEKAYAAVFNALKKRVEVGKLIVKIGSSAVSTAKGRVATIGGLIGGAVKMAARMTFRQVVLWPHAMSRFARGMKADLNADALHAGVTSVQCRSGNTVY